MAGRWLWVAVVIAGCAAARGQASAAGGVADAAVVQVDGRCTGTFVDQTTVITAKHCMTSLEVGTPARLTQPPTAWACPATLARVGVDDWVELTASCHSSVSHPVAGAYAVGDTVTATTYGGLYYGQQRRTGRVVGTTTRFPSRTTLLDLDFQAIGGDSGSAILNADGQVIGVLSESDSATTTAAAAVSDDMRGTPPTQAVRTPSAYRVALPSVSR